MSVSTREVGSPLAGRLLSRAILATSHRLGREIGIAVQRATQVQIYRRLRAYGFDLVQAAEIVGTSYVTIWRLDRAFTARGVAGLLPKTGRCGRKRKGVAK
jgi:hypothetical protein